MCFLRAWPYPPRVGSEQAGQEQRRSEVGKLWASSKLFNSFRMLVAVFFSMSSANNQTGCVACATQKLHGLCPYGSRGYQFSLKVAVAWMLGRVSLGKLFCLWWWDSFLQETCPRLLCSGLFPWHLQSAGGQERAEAGRKGFSPCSFHSL